MPARRYALMLRNIAHQAHRLASEIEDFDAYAERLRGARESARRHRRRWTDITAMLASYLVNGLKAQYACHAVADHAGIEIDQVLGILPRALKMAAQSRQAQRDRAIMVHYRKGYSDAQIAALVTDPRTGDALHPKSVNRIIRRCLAA